MTKKMLILGVVLALVAGMIIPAAVIAAPANTTNVTGNITEATISITAPTAIGFGMLTWGNNTKQSTTGLLVTVTANSRNPASLGGVPWAVTAKDESNGGYMKSGATPLTNKLLIGKDGTTWTPADTGITYNGNGNATGAESAFWARQEISDNETAGAYSITITFTANVNI